MLYLPLAAVWAVRQSGKQEPTIKVALIYLGAIAGAEVLVSAVNAIAGVCLHVAILGALIVHSAVAGEQSQRNLYFALAIAPVIRLLSLTLPLNLFPQIYRYGIVAVPFLAGTFLVARRLRYRYSEIGFTVNRLPVQIAALLVGPLLGLLEFYILKPEPLVPNMAPSTLLLPSFILLVGTGFAEEVTFRGVMQRTAGQALGRGGILYTAGVFTAMHIGYLSAWDLAFVFGVGLLFGWTAKRTGSILGTSIAHGSANIFLYLIFPFLL